MYVYLEFVTNRRELTLKKKTEFYAKQGTYMYVVSQTRVAPEKKTKSSFYKIQYHLQKQQHSSQGDCAKK